MIYLNKISISKSAKKTIRKIDDKTKQRISHAIEGLRFVPPNGDVVKMKGLIDTFRCRVGGWRILFQQDIENDKLIIFDIEVRGQVYK